MTSNLHTSESILSIARIQRPRGFTGDVRATYRGDFLELLEGDEVALYRASGIRDGFLTDPILQKKIKLISVAPAGAGVAALQFEGVGEFEGAELLKGLYIGLPLSEAKKRFFDAQEPYLFQYVGMTLIFRGKPAGEVLRVEENGLQQWFVVSADLGEGPKEIMIPGNGDFIESADFDQNELHVRHLEILDV